MGDLTAQPSAKISPARKKRRLGTFLVTAAQHVQLRRTQMMPIEKSIKGN
jgi:hypothetical protein